MNMQMNVTVLEKKEKGLLLMNTNQQNDGILTVNLDGFPILHLKNEANSGNIYLIPYILHKYQRM